MPAYRFCRTDDIPLLVEAHNRCYAVHFEDHAPLTPEDFKRGARELGLWASSCVLALSGEQPIGVLLAAKRATETLIWRIGVHPDHRGQGHGRHMVESLEQKLAILGPPRILAEVPEDPPHPRRFFESCGFRAETTYADFVLDPAPFDTSPTAPATLAELVTPITLQEILECGAWDPTPRRSWERSLETLRARDLAGQLGGLAVASEARLEAWLLHRRKPEIAVGAREIVALGHAGDEQACVTLGALLKHFQAEGHSAVVLTRVAEDEAGFHALASWGFRKARVVTGWGATATA
jgi:GNAT superfamily N-acetyltransferase